VDFVADWYVKDLILAKYNHQDYSEVYEYVRASAQAHGSPRTKSRGIYAECEKKTYIVSQNIKTCSKNLKKH
jgi:uncharacterized pyridoxamine 5'-phosphate oxidase family protein